MYYSKVIWQGQKHTIFGVLIAFSVYFIINVKKYNKSNNNRQFMEILNN